MNKSLLTCRNAAFFSFLLFFCPLSLSTERIKKHISELEMREIKENSHINFIDLDKNVSPIYQLISDLALVDDNHSSPIHMLKDHIDQGASIGRENDVLDVLEYAEKILEKKLEYFSDQEIEQLSNN